MGSGDVSREREARALGEATAFSKRRRQLVFLEAVFKKANL
jgi:hypothetical protein